jgi:diguanylate cyclase (GGDEF)-like protein
MSKHSKDFEGIPVEAADETALLRQALADAQQRIQALERGSGQDALTPLPNADRFREELARVVAKAERHGTPSAAVCVALPRVAELRQQDGAFAADAAIVHVARLLFGLIRSTDFLARTGGAEFGLVLDHLDHDSAIDAAERLARCIAANPLEIGGRRIALDAKVATAGILAGDSVDDVLRRAAASLTRVKAASSGP